MKADRLGSFSDGVLAIIITIMVLQLRVPEGHELDDLIRSTGVGLLTYLLSFVYIATYWNNHHQMFHLVQHVDGSMLWANLALLFFLSLLPFTTSWLDQSQFATTPVVVYGLNLLVAAIAYFVLQRAIMWRQGPDSPLRRAVGTDAKGKISPILYVAGILSALTIDRGGPVGVGIALACFVGVAVLWIVPDRRIVRVIDQADRT
ncbi:TMEM175 family protein [Solwaraspora sp. WMMD406]|uniref:TMEM175 family protein n=1 Tax=Solwaraspora sp. WMMD406 TaxID=3016095 RepID=UPI0024173887|nr:TMEM175 family protein [Solwaraspora sp. WMMD406]MDG4767921.1 TMEM175 family protein [Solwaraspora sp. WMMD406]